jgi:hypothetical protein
LTVLQGALGFMGTDGGIDRRLQGAASSLTLGIVPRPRSGDELQQAGFARADDFTGRLSTSGALSRQRGTVAQLQRRIATNQRTLATPVETGAFSGAFRIGGHAGMSREAHKQLSAETDALKAELQRRSAILHDSEQAHLQDLRALSVRHASAMADDLTQAFDIRSKGAKGPAGAMDRTVDEVLHRQRRLAPAGAKVLDETMLTWAREQARQNPKLRGEVDRLIDGIERRFSRLGRHVQVVDGQILTGARSEWRNIRVALATETEKAREEATDDFTAIQRQALGSLTSMGFSPAEARQLVRGIESGTGRGAAASRTLSRTGSMYEAGVTLGTRAGPSRPRQPGPGAFGSSNPLMPSGDGPGRSVTIHGSPISNRVNTDNRSSLAVSWPRPVLRSGGPIQLPAAAAPVRSGANPRAIHIHIPIAIPDEQAARLIRRYADGLHEQISRDVVELLEGAAEEPEGEVIGG